MRPAARTAGLGPSPIRVLSEGAPPDTLPLGLGEPGWPLPEVARRALAGEAGPCPYGPNGGLPDLREAVAAFLGTTTERIFVSSGSQGALFALFHAWLEPGAAVLVPDPGFVAYPMLTRLAGAEAVPYGLGPGFGLDLEAFLRALNATPHARLAVVNHPANPTGAGASAEALAAVASACEARGVLLIADEVYRELHLGPRPPGLRDVTSSGVVLGSLSKAWGAPGLRIGWAEGDPALLEPARRLHAAMVTAPARPSQQAALALLQASDTVLRSARAALAQGFRALSESLQDHFGHAPAPPSGGFYHWMPLPPWAEGDPLAFALRLRDEARVVTVPGLAFGPGGRRHLRLSYGGDPETIRTALCRLAPFWRTP
ncbi:MAG: Aspartate aminotransferase [Acidobacteria bacterium ADurb.Bin340]|nr:MAG: Aspartate aminotransferase [Acidobacteria bacterium ADurb.Bin340]HQL48660.1 pyridoxal phosphate-dependent aminotransferase [Holophaga sp.]